MFLRSVTLWFVQARNTDETPSVVNTVSVISFARVPRIEINSDPTVTFLEITITAQKDYLDNFMIEYDEGDANKKRYLYYTKSDAQTQGSIPSETIVDYNETITPVVGIAKPSNFTLTEKGSGFNIDTDVVASKGRLANGDATYNTTFSLSYFDPTFFTRFYSMLLLQQQVVSHQDNMSMV